MTKILRKKCNNTVHAIHHADILFPNRLRIPNKLYQFGYQIKYILFISQLLKHLTLKIKI